MEMLGKLPKTQNMCLSVLPVIPPQLRQRYELSDRVEKPNDLTILYQGKLRANAKLADAVTSSALKTGTGNPEYQQLRRELHRAIAQLMCNESCRHDSGSWIGPFQDAPFDSPFPPIWKARTDYSSAIFSARESIIREGRSSYPIPRSRLRV